MNVFYFDVNRLQIEIKVNILTVLTHGLFIMVSNRLLHLKYLLARIDIHRLMFISFVIC